MHRRFARWVFRNLLWDAAGTSRQGFARALWATRKLILAALISATLDWAEWTHHHPPDMGFIVVAHFVIAVAVVAIVVYARQLLPHSTGP